MSRLPPPVPMPAERVAIVARQTATFAKVIATVLAFALGVSLIGLLADGLSASVVVWLLVLLPLTLKFIGLARRASAVAHLAGSAVTHTFALHGPYMTVSGPGGVELPHLMFAISARHQRALLEIPRATVVS